MALPPGFRFHPTGEELVTYYLKKRVNGIPIEFDVIADVDLYKCEPWDLPEKSRLRSTDPEWFFFSPLDRKYPNGERTNRTTEAGYWKPTGRDSFVKIGARIVGMRKTLVFYLGRGHAHGERTDWLMHEYRLNGDEWEATNVSQGRETLYVLCRVFKKNGFIVGKNNQSGLHELVDSADVSSSEEKHSEFQENDVISSLELPPPPPSTANQLTQTAKSLSESLEAVPLSAVRSALPVVLPLTTDFDHSDSLPQIESNNLFDDMQSGFPVFEEMPDFPAVPPMQATTPGELKEGQQIHADNMASEFVLSDTSSYPKYEDSTASKFAMFDMMGADDILDLDWPPLDDISDLDWPPLDDILDLDGPPPDNILDLYLPPLHGLDLPSPLT